MSININNDDINNINNSISNIDNNNNENNIENITNINFTETSTELKNIDHYLINSILKKGSYSTIYLATCQYTSQQVCIKQINKRFLKVYIHDYSLIHNEINSLKLLKHKNILTLYEIYESKNFIYLITEYIDGPDLFEEIIKKKRFSENESLYIFSQLIDALVYMHKMNITHRDIRTEHILFTKSNNIPKIIDFGYSTCYKKNSKLDIGFGNLNYVCPEMILNNSYDPELADVWSLGVVLFVMTCGYLPFSEESDEKNKQMILKGKIEFPREISKKLKNLLMKMLEIKPNKRFNFHKIINHTWFKPYSIKDLVGGINIIEKYFPVDDKIVAIVCEICGCEKEKVVFDLNMNKFNKETAIYKMICKKLIDEKIETISDFNSNLFVEFLESEKSNKNNNNDNKDNNDDITYEKYLEKIFDNIKKCNEFEEQYDNVEKKIIQELDEIKNDYINNNNNNQIEKIFEKNESSSDDENSFNSEDSKLSSNYNNKNLTTTNTNTNTNDFKTPLKSNDINSNNNNNNSKKNYDNIPKFISSEYQSLKASRKSEPILLKTKINDNYNIKERRTTRLLSFQKNNKKLIYLGGRQSDIQKENDLYLKRANPVNQQKNKNTNKNDDINVNSDEENNKNIYSFSFSSHSSNNNNNSSYVSEYHYDSHPDESSSSISSSKSNNENNNNIKEEEKNLEKIDEINSDDNNNTNSNKKNNKINNNNIEDNNNNNIIENNTLKGKRKSSLKIINKKYKEDLEETLHRINSDKKIFKLNEKTSLLGSNLFNNQLIVNKYVRGKTFHSSQTPQIRKNSIIGNKISDFNINNKNDNKENIKDNDNNKNNIDNINNNNNNDKKNNSNIIFIIQNVENLSININKNNNINNNNNNNKILINSETQTNNIEIENIINEKNIKTFKEKGIQTEPEKLDFSKIKLNDNSNENIKKYSLLPTIINNISIHNNNENENTNNNNNNNNLLNLKEDKNNNEKYNFNTTNKINNNNINNNVLGILIPNSSGQYVLYSNNDNNNINNNNIKNKNDNLKNKNITNKRKHSFEKESNYNKLNIIENDNVNKKNSKIIKHRRLSSMTNKITINKNINLKTPLFNNYDNLDKNNFDIKEFKINNKNNKIDIIKNIPKLNFNINNNNEEKNYSYLKTERESNNKENSKLIREKILNTVNKNKNKLITKLNSENKLNNTLISYNNNNFSRNTSSICEFDITKKHVKINSNNNINDNNNLISKNLFDNFNFDNNNNNNINNNNINNKDSKPNINMKRKMNNLSMNLNNNINFLKEINCLTERNKKNNKILNKKDSNNSNNNNNKGMNIKSKTKVIFNHIKNNNLISKNKTKKTSNNLNLSLNSISNNNINHKLENTIINNKKILKTSINNNSSININNNILNKSILNTSINASNTNINNNNDNNNTNITNNNINNNNNNTNNNNTNNNNNNTNNNNIENKHSSNIKIYLFNEKKNIEENSLKSKKNFHKKRLSMTLKPLTQIFTEEKKKNYNSKPFFNATTISTRNSNNIINKNNNNTSIKSNYNTIINFNKNTKPLLYKESIDLSCISLLNNPNEIKEKLEKKLIEKNIEYIHTSNWVFKTKKFVVEIKSINFGVYYYLIRTKHGANLKRIRKFISLVCNDNNIKK